MRDKRNMMGDNREPRGSVLISVRLLLYLHVTRPAPFVVFFRSSWLLVSDAPTLPCCRDRFGEQACQSLSRSQPEIFERRCLADHDFNTLDCCAECRNYITTREELSFLEKSTLLDNINAENTRTLMKAPQLCKDKHSLTFCRRFKLSGMGKFR